MIEFRKAKQVFEKIFGEADDLQGCFSHGRLEIIGNHTDHNNGLAIVAGCNMGITAAFRASENVHVASEGFRPFHFKANELDYYKEQEGSSLAIVKGVMFRMQQIGYKVGGFTAALKSDILPGSGVSSSACFEALIVKIQLALYNPDKQMSPLLMAQISHFAENKYFGKPCGLLDQIGVCFGGMQYLDFKNFKAPEITPIDFDLRVSLVLVIAPSSHAKLGAYYAQIPADMEEVAEKMFDKKCLRECDRDEFMRMVSNPTYGVSERAKMRAQHYFDENIRVEEARKAIEKKDIGTFLQMIRESGHSSHGLLLNTMIPGQYHNSPQEAIDLATPLLGNGAARIHGGGFAGGMLAVVLKEDADKFVHEMSRYYGSDRVARVAIVEGGPRLL